MKIKKEAKLTYQDVVDAIILLLCSKYERLKDEDFLNVKLIHEDEDGHQDLNELVIYWDSEEK